MIKHEPLSFRHHISLALLSAALIGFQLEQMQLLALLQWYHFAYFIISVALLGFGAAGTCIALWQKVLLRNMKWLLPLLMYSCAMMMALAQPLLEDLLGSFDISLLFVDAEQAALLLFGQCLYLLIFFLGALPLGLVFVRYSSRIGSLYCANLIGSGLGGILTIVCMYVFLPQVMPALTALLPFAAGSLLLPKRPGWLLFPGAIVLIVTGIVLLSTQEVKTSQYKAISRTLDLPGAKVIMHKPSPQGLVQLVTAPALRYAPGLSLTYRGEVSQFEAAVFNSGDWFGPLRIGESATLDASATALPYAMAARKRVLVLKAGTGVDVLHAVERGARMVMAIEPHRKAVETVVAFNGEEEGPFINRAVTLSFLAPRTWLALSRQQYDLITHPIVGNFGGASGLYALQEEYLLTREGLLDIWHHLSDEGVFRISAWLDSPPRNSLRLAASIAETLEGAGVQFSSHVAVISGWDMMTFVIKRSPLTADDVQRIRAFCKELQFDPVLLPGLEPGERERFHVPSDKKIFTLFDSLTTSHGREELYSSYPFNLRPVTDNRPFFSQFLRWQSLPQLVRLFGERALPYLEMGYVLVLAGVVQMTIAAAFLILLPLFRLGIPGRDNMKIWTVPYFSGLGLGYMFYEIVLIHELVLYFGHPILAASAVISSLLFFSGLGSLLSGRLKSSHMSPALSAALVAFLLLLNLFALQPLLHGTIAWPAVWKIFCFLFLIGPVAFMMGMPFPLGLARLARHSQSQAAWAWGINGSVSVVSAGLAAIVAIELGFSAVMMMSCCAYILAALSARKG